MALLSPFRRLVLSLAPGAMDRERLRAAADFAHLLELEMLGVFVENQAILGMTELPFARELRLPGHAWHPLDPQRIAADLRAAADQARRLFDEEVAPRGIARHFEVRRGDPATAACALGEASDIVVLSEPAAATDRLALDIVRAWRAALTSPASVLLLPSTAALHRGPVAAVAAEPSERAAVIASRIAEAVRDELVMVPPPEIGASATLASSLERVLGSRRERLVVVGREHDSRTDEASLSLAAARRVPVLVVDGDEAGPPRSKRRG